MRWRKTLPLYKNLSLFPPKIETQRRTRLRASRYLYPRQSSVYILTTSSHTSRSESRHIKTPPITDSTDLHSAPPWFVFLHDKKRAIFRDWPRDPNGRTLRAGLEFRGKEAPNGFLSWGATLYDFYRVRSMPRESWLIAITSGSRIAATVRAAGETELSANQLAWADREADPCEVPVVDPGELIESYERSACTRIYDEFSAVEGVRARRHGGNPSNSGNRGKGGVLDIGITSVLMSDWPPSSPFHPSHYPEPWPFIPFSNPELSTLLQKRIPLHLLPQTLYVHDPYDLLSVRHDCYYDPWLDREVPWLIKPPSVHRYKLNLIPGACDTAQKARKEAEAEEIKKKRVLHVYRFPPSEEERARGEPTYDVPLPTKPPGLTQVEEAHLYISPTGNLGEGNHSVVYKAEFELPRDLFLEPKMCSACVFNELQKEVRKLKESGKWRKMLRAAGCELPPKGDDEGSGEEDHETPVPHEEFDQEVISVQQHTQSNSKSSESTPCPETNPHVRVYCPEVRWEDPQTPCEHMPDRHLRPRTAMFQVAAKLSVRDDEQLEREARNYQSFPDHFFQHWSGYNIVRPIYNPVPVHALVPQFYGYYVPEVVPFSIGMERPGYLSPILLLEACGTQVVPSKLDADDREECVSLFLRFNHAGWLHESIAERNFLYQLGPPTMRPSERPIKGPSSFRLIDFGRSRFVEERVGGEFRIEENDAIKLFNVSLGRYWVP